MLHSSEAKVQGDNAGISKDVNPNPWLDSSSSEAENLFDQNTQKAVPETASEIRNDFDDETSVSGEQSQNLDAETLNEHIFVEYICFVCEERFENKKLVETHVRTKHKNISERDSQKETPKHSERGKSMLFYKLANWFLILSTLMQLVQV